MDGSIDRLGEKRRGSNLKEGTTRNDTVTMLKNGARSRRRYCGGLFSMGSPVSVLLGLLFILIRDNLSAYAQPGFLSIDCGTSSSYTDALGISWSTDSGYIRAGQNAALDTSAADLGIERQQIAQQMSSARVFTESTWTKFCYVLPLQLHSLYLIRLRFLAGNLISSNSSSINFEISAGSYAWGSLYFTADNSLSQQAVEFVLVTPGASNLSLCLVPKTGTPFISSLEARLLPATSYQSVNSPQTISRLIHRWNCGASQAAPPVRYPDDLYDRIYYLPPAVYSFTSVSNASFTYDPKITRVLAAPPLAALHSAWVAPRGQTIGIALPGFDLTKSIVTYLYFAELQSLGNGTQREVFGTLYNKSMGPVFVSTSGPSMMFNITQSIDDFAASVNAARTSAFGPILNVFEAYELEIFNNTVTLQADERAIRDFTASLNLAHWMGDPCLPVAWEWLNCSSPGDTAIPRITEINLANFNLSGPIPESLSQLTALEALSLQNNQLSGTIPASLASLPNLVVLCLDNNRLIGEVPRGLLVKQQSKFFIFSATGNPGLCYGTNSACKSHGHRHERRKYIAGIISGVIGAVVAVITLLVVVLLLHKKRALRKTYKEGSVATKDQERARHFSYEEVRTATNDFQQFIGKGVSGNTFYGKLLDGKELAVKRLSTKSGESTSDLSPKDGQATSELSAKDASAAAEFRNKVELLFSVQHGNLQSLVGYCDEAGHRILIYPFESEGNLREHLDAQTKKPLDWKARLNIAFDSARGLEYLHNSCSPPIIHGDAKSSNILLTKCLLARVAGFGVSEIATETDQVHGLSTEAKGSLDPEHLTGRRLTTKTDVYYFGVVLLELVTGKNPVYKTQSDEEGALLHLQKSVSNAANAGDMRIIMDPYLQQGHEIRNLDSVSKVVELGVECLQAEGFKRPDMKKILEVLSRAIELETGHTRTAFDVDGDHMPRLLTSASYKSYQRMNSSSSKRTSGFFSISRYFRE